MLDTEKTFDQVSWPFLIGVCKKIGFHQKFINLLMGMYKDSTARVNGTLSKKIPIMRGTKQGDPLSPEFK